MEYQNALWQYFDIIIIHNYPEEAIVGWPRFSNLGSKAASGK
jgi:hypothetical protein